MRPVQEAENRLSRWAREKAPLMAEVERRVVSDLVRAAEGGGDASLEYVLNDAAFHEIRRLDGGLATPAERRRLPEWRELARRVGFMTEEEKRTRLRELVREYVEDIVGHFDPRVYKLAKNVGPPLLSALLSPQSLRRGVRGLQDLSSRIRVEGPLDHLRACADRGTLVVTPTHSSNMDSVVIGWALLEAGLPPVTYGAGKNLWSNPFLGFFMRNLGAYRVDRRLKHKLYLTVLKEYQTVLFERGYHSLFFPGGTRSRSGAVETHLKLGLLGTTIPAYLRLLKAGESSRRLYVVPVTINYGICLEAETLIDDFLAEEGKHRYIIEDDEFSRLWRIVDFSRQILALEGAVVIRFGAPLDPFGNAVDPEGESIDARGRRIDPASYLVGPGGQLASDPQRDAEYTRQLGEELKRAFRRLTVFLPTHLVARALFDRLALQEGTRDVYRLLRVREGAEIGWDDLCEDVEALRRRIAAHPEWGALSERASGLSAAQVIADGLRAFGGYHTRPVAEHAGDRVVIRHLRLLFYYQNRTAHVPSGFAQEAMGRVA